MREETDTHLLIESALGQARNDPEGGSDERWDAVVALHGRPERPVFERAVEWCRSRDVLERCLGADVLGQLGCEERAYPFRTDTLPVLAALLSDENADVVQSALIAFGHLGAAECVTEVAALSGHPDPDVRHGVAFALLGDESERAIETLIALSADDDVHVRDWATFGLGAQVELDTEAIRAALLARVVDADHDTRSEALMGLARRGDERVVPLLRRVLERDSVAPRDVEAARALGDPSLLPQLERLRSWWDVDPSLLDEAISRCTH